MDSNNISQCIVVFNMQREKGKTQKIPKKEQKEGMGAAHCGDTQTPPCRFFSLAARGGGEASSDPRAEGTHDQTLKGSTPLQALPHTQAEPGTWPSSGPRPPHETTGVHGV